MRKILKEKLPRLLGRLARANTLYLPRQQEAVVSFAPWQEGDSAAFEALNTAVPPKSIIFPQWETFMRFKTQGKTLELQKKEEESGGYLLFGIRPCDMASFFLLDRVFLEEPGDLLYARRREGTFISLGCSAPDEACFCTAFDLEPGWSGEADVMCWDLGKALLWEPQSEKGRHLTESQADLLVEASAEEAKTALEGRKSAAARQKEALHRKGWVLDRTAEKLEEMFDAPLWDLFRRCIGCGICTYLCPTCHCFDIQDHSAGQSGERFRCWDSCMYEDFTLMASGENPRPTKKERIRQRFMHKLCYFPNRFGHYGCVGCGRCVRGCPVMLDITQVIKEAGKRGGLKNAP